MAKNALDGKKCGRSFQSSVGPKTVSSQLYRRISEVLVNFNDVVKAGQVIARVDPEAYIAAVKKVRAALNIAKATTGLSQAALQRAKAAIESARIASKAGEADFGRCAGQAG